MKAIFSKGEEKDAGMRILNNVKVQLASSKRMTNKSPDSSFNFEFKNEWEICRCTFEKSNRHFWHAKIKMNIKNQMWV